jgi:phosphopantothenoylcysteine decarboxylase/phosphopantothenate--cysteine ligase
LGSTITAINGKNIILGVTGSIACYKAVDLASKLTQAGAVVETILTESASKFVTPLSFKSVTGCDVFMDMWREDEHVQHIKLGEKSDLFLVAPATAHTIAKLALGLTDNLLTLTALASRCPIAIAPAMDGGMYQKEVTQKNLRTLGDRGFVVIGPTVGRMASGLTGKGRMVEPAEIIGYVRQLLGSTGIMSGRKVVVSAGPTQEPLDPVRFLSNRSSGRQGIALAQAAIDSGASVTLVSGPVNLPFPIGARVISIKTANEMAQAVLEASIGADSLIMAAAVADYRPDEVVHKKIKKIDRGDSLSLALTANPDILELVKEQRQQTGWPRVTVGFAAETDNFREYGQAKLEKKGLDFIAVNDVGAVDSGFEVETNRILWLSADGLHESFPIRSKEEISETIIEEVSKKLAQLESS